MSDGLIPNSFTLQHQNSNKLKENALVKTAMHISNFHLVLFNLFRRGYQHCCNNILEHLKNPL